MLNKTILFFCTISSIYSMDTNIPVWQAAIDGASSLDIQAYKAVLEEKFPLGIENRKVGGYALLKIALSNQPDNEENRKRIEFLRNIMNVDLNTVLYDGRDYILFTLDHSKPLEICMPENARKITIDNLNIILIKKNEQQ
ncbi:MAG: hypothetical protein M1114_05395 [Candidatus Dependentiae bacterium]|nr:hypothetical protein [Candidatus Dependentiae bacterium]